MSFSPEREEDLFHRALALPAVERASFLDREAAEDGELRSSVESLLSLHDDAQSCLVPALLGGVAEAMPQFALGLVEKPGSMIGRYKLLQKIGEGGCGVVYMAEQQEPVVRRVALKVIKLGMDTQAVVARFEAERQALAMMEHPSIAKVLDGGTTQTGRPYFVMELVRGIPITTYCDEHQLTPARRLEIFVKVCEAVQHAHQKGVIHRDLKPSNILVTVNDGVSTPKVIDFGIAKATQGRLTDATVFTAFEQFIGTPVYMSPEQAEMSSLDIDTRSDIYSLGVLLYELLTGQPPFDPKAFAHGSANQIRQQIRQAEPTKPSRRLGTMEDAQRTTIARLRKTAPEQLSILLRGDLDWIVMRCLEKDRTRRYDTANGLALDIQRHLHDEPVTARPPSSAYVLQKLIRRNRVAAIGTAALGSALMLGLIVSWSQAVRARRAESLEAESRLKAEAAERKQSALRERAEAGEAEARFVNVALRQRTYTAEMFMVQQALGAGNLDRAIRVLDKYRPNVESPAADLRGFEWRYLWGQARSDETSTLGTYYNGLGGLAVSPDGQLLAAVNGTAVEIRSVQSRKGIKKLSLDGDLDARGESRNRGWTLKFSPDGQWLVAGPNGSSLRLRRWHTGTWEEHPGIQGSAPFAFALGGSVLVARMGTEFSLWSTTTWSSIGQLAGAPFHNTNFRQVTSIAVSHDGGVVYYGGSDEGIRSWDVATGRELEPLKSPNAWASSLAISREGLLAAAHINGKISLWEVASRRLLQTFDDHRSWASCVAFSPDGSVFASAASDQVIMLYDARERKLLRRIVGHRGEIWSMIFSSDGESIFSGSTIDDTIRVWSPAKARNAVDRLDGVQAVEFTDSGRSLICVTPEQELKRYDLVSQEWSRIEHNLPFALTDLGAPSKCLSLDFERVSRIEGGVVEIWNLRTGRREKVLAHNNGPVTAIAFSEDGRVLATAAAFDRCAEFRLWDMGDWSSETFQWTEPVPPSAPDQTTQPMAVKQIVVNAGGKLFAAGVGRQFIVFDRFAGWSRLDFQGAANRSVGSAVIARDGSKLVLGTLGPTNSVRIWDLKIRPPLQTRLLGHLAGVFGVALSPDGRTLASCGEDHLVKLWNLELREEILSLPSERATSTRVLFSPDGRWLAVNSTGNMIQLWHAPAWEEIAESDKNPSTSLGKR